MNHRTHMLKTIAAGMLLTLSSIAHAYTITVEEVTTFDRVNMINDDNVMVGTVNNRAAIGALDETPTLIDGGLGAQSHGSSINNSGNAAGLYLDLDIGILPFYWTPNLGTQDLSVGVQPNGGPSINELNDVFFIIGASADTTFYAVHQDYGTRSLVTGVFGAIQDINAVGEVLLSEGFGARNALIKATETGLSYTPLEFAGFERTKLNALNDLGQVVGRVVTVDGHNQAVIWDSVNGMQFLINHQALPDITGSIAIDINNAGVISVMLQRGGGGVEFALLDTERKLVRYSLPDFPLPTDCNQVFYTEIRPAKSFPESKSIDTSGRSLVSTVITCERDAGIGIWELLGYADASGNMTVLPLPGSLTYDSLYQTDEVRFTGSYLSDSGIITTNFSIEAGSNFNERPYQYDIGPPKTTIIGNILDDVTADIDTLIQGGVLAEGEATSLISQLETIATLSEQENVTAACNVTKAFIKQVEAKVRAGSLTTEDAATLTDSATLLAEEACL